MKALVISLIATLGLTTPLFAQSVDTTLPESMQIQQQTLRQLNGGASTTVNPSTGEPIGGGTDPATGEPIGSSTDPATGEPITQNSTGCAPGSGSSGSLNQPGVQCNFEPPSNNGSSTGTAGLGPLPPFPPNPASLLPAPLPPSSQLSGFGLSPTNPTLSPLSPTSGGLTSHVGSVSGGRSTGGH
jgi:hypothetical protein